MDQLPNHIVLDDVGLVHAGYDPKCLVLKAIKMLD